MKVKRQGKGKEGDLRVWHVPQVPGAAFHVAVASPSQGKMIMRILGDYDLFQMKHRIKPDYSNANGLEVSEGGEWVTWYDQDGNNIDELELGANGELQIPTDDDE